MNGGKSLQRAGEQQSLHDGHRWRPFGPEEERDDIRRHEREPHRHGQDERALHFHSFINGRLEARLLVLQTGEYRNRDPAEGTDEHFAHQHGHPRAHGIEAAEHRAEKPAHEKLIRAAVHQPDEVGPKQMDAEAQEPLRPLRGEVEAGAPGGRAPEEDEIQKPDGELLGDQAPGPAPL